MFCPKNNNKYTFCSTCLQYYFNYYTKHGRSGIDNKKIKIKINPLNFFFLFGLLKTNSWFCHCLEAWIWLLPLPNKNFVFVEWLSRQGYVMIFLLYYKGTLPFSIMCKPYSSTKEHPHQATIVKPPILTKTLYMKF